MSNSPINIHAEAFENVKQMLAQKKKDLAQLKKAPDPDGLNSIFVKVLEDEIEHLKAMLASVK